MTSTNNAPNSNNVLLIVLAAIGVSGALLVVCGGLAGFVLYLNMNKAMVQRNANSPESIKSTKERLRKIGLALLNYESAYKKFPPAYTVDAAGNKMHSWRVAILPFLEEVPLYQSIDMGKPWDHPSNLTAYNIEPNCYVQKDKNLDHGLTTVLAIVAPHTVFDLNDWRD